MAKLTISPESYSLIGNRYGISIDMEIAPEIVNTAESVYGLSIDFEVNATIVNVESNVVPSTANIRLVAMQSNFSDCFLQDENNRLMVSINSIQSYQPTGNYSWNLTLISRKTRNGNNLARPTNQGNIYCIVTIDSVGGIYIPEVELNFRVKGVTIDDNNRSHALTMDILRSVVV